MIKTITRSNYAREKVTTGIVHIGLGAFHRAHQAVYIEKNLNRHNGGEWGICAVNIRSNHKLVELLASHSCRYHIAEYTDSQQAHLREVSAIKEALFAGEDKEDLFDRLVSPNTKIVTLTVTEKGYCLTPADKKLRLDDSNVKHDIDNPSTPKTAPGILVEALYRRKATGLAPFTILSCDNMPNNGQLTRQAVCQLASYRSKNFGQWVADEVAFPCSMVDRIVPAMSEESLIRLQTELDCHDPNAVMCEAFSQWVVEDNFPLGRPDWELDGVQMVKDVHPFETMKLRLLNGSHSLLAYVGLAANYKTVAQAVTDEKLVGLIRDYMKQEAAPTLSLPEEVDVETYIENLISRFANDSLQHQLAQIATDGSQKIPQRWLNGSQERLDQGKSVSAVALGLAAWLLYGRGEDLQGQTHSVDDPMAEALKGLHDQTTDTHQLVRRFLDLTDVFPSQLANTPELAEFIHHIYQTLLSKGPQNCLPLDRFLVDTAAVPSGG